MCYAMGLERGETMEYLQAIITEVSNIAMITWNEIRVIAANPFLVAFITICALGDIAVWAIKRR